MRQFGFGLALIFLFASAAWAQGALPADDPLAEGIAAYNASDYSLALEKLNVASTQTARYTDKQLAECHRYLAMTYLAFDTSEEARKQFLRALELDPTLGFNPDITSPKILAAFEQAKATYLLMAQAGAKTPEGKPKSAEPSSNRGRTVAGWTLVGVGGASALASCAFYGLMWDRAAKYDAENDSKSRADKLKSEGLAYRNYSAATAGVAVVTAGIGAWLLLTRDKDERSGAAEYYLLPGPGAGLAFGATFK